MESWKPHRWTTPLGLGQDYLKKGPPGAFNGQPDSQKLKKLVKRKSVRGHHGGFNPSSNMFQP